MAEGTQTRNSEALASFVAYCEANPDQRFWQALTNWSGASTIYLVPAAAWDHSLSEFLHHIGLRNPYGWEGAKPTA